MGCLLIFVVLLAALMEMIMSFNSPTPMRRHAGRRSDREFADEKPVQMYRSGIVRFTVMTVRKRDIGGRAAVILRSRGHTVRRKEPA